MSNVIPRLFKRHLNFIKAHSKNQPHFNTFHVPALNVFKAIVGTHFSSSRVFSCVCVSPLKSKDQETKIMTIINVLHLCRFGHVGGGAFLHGVALRETLGQLGHLLLQPDIERWFKTSLDKTSSLLPCRFFKYKTASQCVAVECPLMASLKFVLPLAFVQNDFFPRSKSTFHETSKKFRGRVGGGHVGVEGSWEEALNLDRFNLDRMNSLAFPPPSKDPPGVIVT